MTVKIKNKYLYNKYLNCMNPGEAYAYEFKLEKGSKATDWCYNPAEILTQSDYAKIKAAGDKSFSAYDFLKHVRGEDGLDEVKAVVNAIFDGEKVELDEQKYYIELPHIGKENSFLNLDRCDGHAFFGDNINDKFFRTRLAMTEIEKRFPKFKQFAVPVKEK